jgi:hypothetical protein
MRHAGWLCGLMLCLVISACSEESAGPTGEQASVSGKVTFDGTPVTVNSSVVFNSLDPAVTAAGEIDSQGNYTLRAANPEVGIPVGRYRVMIRPPTPAPVTDAVDTAEYQKMMQTGGSATPPQVEAPKDIPAKFSSFDSSGIVLELKPGPNTFDFDLAKLP